MTNQSLLAPIRGRFHVEVKRRDERLPAGTDSIADSHREASIFTLDLTSSLVMLDFLYNHQPE